MYQVAVPAFSLLAAVLVWVRRARHAAARHLRVCGIGHPLLDITSHVDQDFLSRFAVKEADTTLAEPHHKPVLFEALRQRPDVEYHPGGATLNAIRACQWFLKQDGPPAAAYIGCIGRDHFGSILREEVRQYGVEGLLLENPEHPTGTCGCMIVGKERSLVANLGAAQHLSTAMCEGSDFQELIKSSDIFYMAGFILNLLPRPQPGEVFPALHVARHALQHDKPLCLNLSAPYLCDAFREQWIQLFPYADYIFGNTEDYMAMARALGWEQESIHRVAMRFAQYEKLNAARHRVVVVTRGHLPAVVCTCSGFKEFSTPFVAPRKIKDLNGAGDAFVGGFLSQLAHRRSLRQCMVAAQYAASVVIRQPACTFPCRPSLRFTLRQAIMTLAELVAPDTWQTADWQFQEEATSRN